LLVSFGILWLGATSLIRVFWWTSGADFWTVAIPQLIQGAGMPFFFIPLTTLALGAVDEDEMASAAGVMNFLRTMAGAVGTALVTTIWYDGAQGIRDQLSGVLSGAQATMETLQARGYSLEQSRQIISQTVDGQAMALSPGSTASRGSARKAIAVHTPAAPSGAGIQRSRVSHAPATFAGSLILTMCS